MPLVGPACADDLVIDRSFSWSSSAVLKVGRSARRRSATSRRSSGRSRSSNLLITYLYARAGRFLTGPAEKLAADRAWVQNHVHVQDFERSYAEHAQPLLRFLIYRTGDRVLSEDIVADTFERALRSRARFNPRKSSEKTWIYSIALNLLRDHARHDAVAARALERDHAPVVGSPAADALADVEDRDLIHRALATLAPEEREAIALRYGADLTMPEIAKLTKERLSTVEGRVYRALRKLRDELG
jgi:RNA polymerase sigma factor (sigma-70 family)